MKIRNRVKELRSIRARDLVSNPKNWRTHPPAQERALRDLLGELGYADALLAQMMQSVACNALHSIEARCSRWLLSTQDRMGQAAIPLTQEALAEMLGVQRTTVTAVAQALQARGLIRYARGRVEILNREGIEELACECYAAVEDHFEKLLPEIVDAGG